VSSPQQLQYAQNCGSGIRTSTLDRPMFVCIFFKVAASHRTFNHWNQELKSSPFPNNSHRGSISVTSLDHGKGKLRNQLTY